MKKIIAYTLTAILAVSCFTACSTKSPIQTVTDATASQARNIEKWLSEINIVCKKINISSSNSTSDLNKDWEAYDIIGENEKKYILILQRQENGVAAVLDEKDDLLLGEIDSTLWQSKFNEIQKNQVIINKEHIEHDENVTVVDTITQTHRIIVTSDGANTSVYSENFALGVASLSVNGQVTEVYDMNEMRKGTADKTIWIVVSAVLILMNSMLCFFYFRKRHNTSSHCLPNCIK